jgi:hypothetical protein
MAAWDRWMLLLPAEYLNREGMTSVFRLTPIKHQPHTGSMLPHGFHSETKIVFSTQEPCQMDALPWRIMTRGIKGSINT